MGKKRSGRVPRAKILPMDMSKTTASTEKKVYVNRPALFPNHRVAESVDVLSNSQGPGQVGTAFTASTFSFSASKLSTNMQNWVQSYDAYRFRLIEVYANLTFATKVGSGVRAGGLAVTHYCYEDIDTSEGIDTSWLRTLDRSNINRVVLTEQRPSAKVASFVPQPTFQATSGTQHSDLIGKEMEWVDAIDMAFSYAGLRCYSTCLLKQNAPALEYDYAIQYEVRVSIDARCNI